MKERLLTVLRLLLEQYGTKDGVSRTTLATKLDWSPADVDNCLGTLLLKQYVKEVQVPNKGPGVQLTKLGETATKKELGSHSSRATEATRMEHSRNHMLVLHALNKLRSRDTPVYWHALQQECDTLNQIELRASLDELIDASHVKRIPEGTSERYQMTSLGELTLRESSTMSSAPIFNIGNNTGNLMVAAGMGITQTGSQNVSIRLFDALSVLVDNTPGVVHSERERAKSFLQRTKEKFMDAPADFAIWGTKLVAALAAKEPLESIMRDAGVIS